MATQVARDLSFSEVANLTSFEDLRRYANWPEDVRPPLLLTRLSQDVVKLNIREISLGLITSNAEKFPKLKKQLDELSKNCENVNLTNFKVYLSLKTGFDVWVDGSAISDDTVNNIMIPEVKQTIREAQKQAKKHYTNGFDKIERDIERAFKIPEKAHPRYGYPSQSLCDDLTAHHKRFKLSGMEYLSPYTSIVAPSGTGKSYTISQLAVKHSKYVIYLNFAPQEHVGYPGTSPYTRLILQTLDEINSKVSFVARRNIMEWKWALIMKTLLCLARTARALGISSEDFFRYQIEKRYAAVQQKITSTIDFVIKATLSSGPVDEEPQSLPEFAPFSRLFQSVFRDDANNSDDNNNGNYISESNSQEGAIEQSNQCFSGDDHEDGDEDSDMSDSSVRQVSGQDSQSDLEFIICIDEARNLLVDKIERIALPFRALRSALWSISQEENEESFFAVFLDTASTISNFAPPVIQDPSQKVAIHDWPGRKIFPPHCRFYTKHVYAEPTPSQLVAPSTSLATMLTFGHPLWGALALEGSSPQNIMQLCLQKCNPFLGTHTIDHKRTGLLALLSYRIPFNFCAFTLAERLVSGWMHCLVDVSEDREKLMVVQPTDPILAIAAFKHGVTMGEILLQVLGALDHFLYWRSIDVGDIGEFVAGLILLLAFDANVKELPKPIPLKGFLRSLFGDQVVTEFTGVCRKGLSDEVKTMFSHGQVFFNRLYRRITKPTRVDLYKMYRTCTACYLPTGLYGVNILIPVFIPKRQNREAYLGCILVQVKNRAYDKFDTHTKNSAYDHIKIGCQQLEFDEMPIIGLMMCLRGESTGTIVRPPSGDDKKNLGVILSVGLDSERYPIFTGSRTRSSEQCGHEVLRALQSFISEVNKIVLNQNKDACEYLTFQSEFLP